MLQSMGSHELDRTEGLNNHIPNGRGFLGGASG